ncbi:MAG: SctK family type III secretion system sorting platform protein [Burkholderiaceae bacterium]|nr:SctK family type III secretion system sorting platform protein [Burkholderiaceae bacterium]
MNAQALFGERLLAFNLLPSRTLHPTRHAHYGAPARPVPAAMAPAWHRIWSRDILRRLELHDRPMNDVGRPELPLALLPPDRLARLVRYAGAALCAPRMRHAIAGSEVRRLSADLGADVLDFARQSAPVPAQLAAVADDSPLSASALDRWGYATLMGAMAGGGPELALRVELKLPDGATGEPSSDATACLAMTLDILKLTEPTWHSSFLAMR